LSTIQFIQNKKIAVGIFGIVMLLILVNLFSPLRLNTDGIRYLNILEFLKGNLDNSSYASKDFLPHGYPWLLYFLDRLHLLSAWLITLVNIASVLISSCLLAGLLKIKNKLIYFTLVMISFINIKQYTLPISDQLFTLLFIASIYFWTLFLNGKNYLFTQFKFPGFRFIPATIYVLLGLISLFYSDAMSVSKPYF
jgi:hypothetical protein